jgi:hypothetical protein
MPVLLVSGYADSAAIEAALGSAPVLRKPFDMTQLAHAVAETLERRPMLSGAGAPGGGPGAAGVRGLSNS